MKEVLISEFKAKCIGMINEIQETGETLVITRRGKPVLAIMTWEDYEAILETLEVLSDDEAVEQLRRSIREVKEGKAIPWEEAKARSGFRPLP